MNIWTKRILLSLGLLALLGILYAAFKPLPYDEVLPQEKWGAGAIRPLFFKTLECSTVVGFNFPPGRIDHLPARNDNDIYSCQRFAASEQLANEPFRPIPDDRVSNFLAGRDAEARQTDLVWQGEAGHQPAPVPLTVVVDPGELRPTAQFHRDDETDSRLRPFARRRFSTMRPFLVCMRTRKPCVRARLTLEGWKVRLVAIVVPWRTGPRMQRTAGGSTQTRGPVANSAQTRDAEPATCRPRRPARAARSYRGRSAVRPTPANQTQGPLAPAADKSPVLDAMPQCTVKPLRCGRQIGCFQGPFGGQPRGYGCG